MNRLDDMIHEALAERHPEILQETQELGYFRLAVSQFRGRLGWVTWVIMITQVALFAAGIWCAAHFFAATEVLLAVKWGISGAVLLLMGLALKLSLVPQMQADRVIRELRRVAVLGVAQRD